MSRVLVSATYERSETWAKNGLLPYGVRVWRPRGCPPTPGTVLGAKVLHNGTLSRDQIGRVTYAETHRLTVLVVRLDGEDGHVYAPERTPLLETLA